MDEASVVLEYRRVVDKSTGKIYVATEEGQRDVFSFEDVDFSVMLREFAVALQQHPSALAVFQRTDRPGLLPYKLDDQIVALFREDPVAAIASLSAPALSPSLAVQRSKEERTPPAPTLRAGFDTLADAFGEDVYVRYNPSRERAECPACGFWQPIDPTAFRCGNGVCALHLEHFDVSLVNEKWASFRVAALLDSKALRFYLPRAWNDGRPWISKDDLSRKYNDYQKEKTSW